jgi:hypothetical protein
MRRRGEVFTFTVLVIACAAAFLFGSVNNPIKSLFGIGNSGNKTKQTVTIKTESKPIIVKGDDGKTYVLQMTKSEKSTLSTNEEPKLTLWQKLLVLPRLWLILMILGIFFPPVAAIMHIINQKLLGETKKIVGGVEESLKNLDAKNPEAKQEVLDTLSKKYDGSTKLLVSKIKSKL